MKHHLLALTLLGVAVALLPGSARAQRWNPPTPAVGAVAPPPPPPADYTPSGGHQVDILSDNNGYKMQVDGQDFFIQGMNWGYVPVGENYAYDFWGHDDEWIAEALHNEMTLLASMGVNSIRQYPDIPPRWVTWIYENYGVTTMINHTMGRYGFTIDGRWVPQVDYADPRTREVITEAILDVVRAYKDVPGVVMWCLGNENNYGLFWESSEIEALPEEEREEVRARALYSLFGDITDAIKTVDTTKPVSIANGDVQFIDLIAELVPNMDIFGSNVYRGPSSRDLFAVVEEKLGVPFVYTEFGADAYNARLGREDGLGQARYLHAQWQEIYEMAYGHGRVGNAIGGYTFQWSDGWWKYRQEINLDVHDTNASWPNRGYPHDFVEGGNNMNEEWFGICAKGPTDSRGMFELAPRASYYLLQAAYQLDPYDPSTDLEGIRAHFGGLAPIQFQPLADASGGALIARQLSRVFHVGARADFHAIITGQHGIDPTSVEPALDPEQPTRVDHMESIYLDIAIRPDERFSAEVSLNILGNVPSNPIDEIFYERRGRPEELLTADGDTFTLEGIERLRLYSGEIIWENQYFDLHGFYRVGHEHWGQQGDFFGLYPETFYGPNLDIYDGEAPVGIEMRFKGPADGLRLAFGPQLFWGANPSLIVGYDRSFGPIDFAVHHSEDLARQNAVSTSNAIPEPLSRKTSLFFGVETGPIRFELGGLMAGTNKIGQPFRYVVPGEEPTYAGSGYYVIQDQVQFADTLAAKGRFRLAQGPVQFYVEGSYRGLVADSGRDFTIPVTKWTLERTGRGNHWDIMGGAAFQLGHFLIAPHVLYQQPLVGPMPALAGQLEADGTYYPALSPRNVRDNAFAVLDNREMLGLELLLAYDPQPVTWLFNWNNADREFSPFAASLNFVYRIHRTGSDAPLGFLADGTLVSFGDGPGPAHTWDATLRMIGRPRAGLKLEGILYAGRNQPRGPDPRLITRGGGELNLHWRRWALSTGVKLFDWGPYDYHRDFNLTYPVQAFLDTSMGIELPRFTRMRSEIGLKGTYRMLDEYSPRFFRDPLFPDRNAHEWEINTYVRLSL